MLSGETAIGHDPALAVETMDRIAHTTEAYARSLPPRIVELSQLVARTFSAAQEHGADLVVVSSRTGSWARRLSRAPLSIPILALSEDLGTARRMQLLRGVEAAVIATTNDQPAFDEFLPAIIRRRFGVEPGTSLRVVVLAPDMLTDDVEVREVQL
jgi:pyruvate kinase